MDYRSRWQQKRRERATRVRLIVIVALLIGATASMLFVRGVSRPAPSGYELPGSGIFWVTASDDGVLITTRSGELVKLTPTLQPVQEGWAGPFTHPAGFRGRCVIAGPCVLVPCEDVRVRAVDLKFGIESWELEVGAAVPAITAYGERAYFTTAEPALYAATADGTELWRTELEAEAPAQPLVTNESVVVGTLAGSVCAYERATGKLLWRVLPEDPAPVQASPIMGPSSILVGDDGARLHSITREGELLASMQFEGLVRHAPAVNDALVIAGDSAGIIVRVNPVDMSEIWRVRLHGPLAASPVIEGGSIWCAGGRELVELSTDGEILTRRVADADTCDLTAAHRRIYWATTDGCVGAVRTEEQSR